MCLFFPAARAKLYKVMLLRLSLRVNDFTEVISVRQLYSFGYLCESVILLWDISASQ
jgi:hypothetical protein